MPATLSTPLLKPAPNPLRTAILAVLSLTLAISVASWPLHFYGSDPLAVREEARALILHGTLKMDNPIYPLNLPGMYFVQNPRDGGWYSKYGVFGSIASVPPLAMEYFTTGELPPLDSRDRMYLLNAWNTVLTLLLAVVLVRLASLYTRRAWAMATFALTSLFCTFLWNYTRAQASEIVQVLLACAAFDQLIRFGRDGRRWRVAYVWTLFAALVLTRLYFATLFPVLMIALLPRRPGNAHNPRHAGGYFGELVLNVIVPPILIMGLLAWLNFVKFGSPFLTGYHAFEAGRHKLTLNPWPGLYGFLVSPAKGVWWHFPLMVLALPAWPGFIRRHRREALILIAGALIYTLPLCTIASWAGEWSYGPRYLLFGLPLVSLPVVLLGEISQRSARWITGISAALVLTIGFFLNWEVNRLEFFVSHDVRNPLRDLGPPAPPNGWPDDYAPYPGRWYFEERPWGMLIGQLLWADGKIERLPFDQTAKEVMTPERYDAYRKYVRIQSRRTNWWWGTMGKRFDESRYREAVRTLDPQP